MRQFHARAHFSRVDVIDARRRQMIADYQARYCLGLDVNRDVCSLPRYARLCRAAAMYRIAGFLNSQEL